MRKTDRQRDTRPQGPELFADEEEKARLEARNGLLQFDEVMRILNSTFAGERFKLRPSTLQTLHRVAIKDIYRCAGNFRTDAVEISNTPHTPPPFEDVPRLTEGLCDYVNEQWERSALHLSAWMMWRVNWIHPFMGGNGRTARAASYLVLCARLGHHLPGTLSIPEQIVTCREPYYAALDAADLAWTTGKLDLAEMELLLGGMLAKQLLAIHERAHTGR